MKSRDPVEKIIIPIPPGGYPSGGYPWPNFPGHGPGPVIPPWLNPNKPGIPNKPDIPDFPPIPDDEEKIRIKLKSVYASKYVVIQDNDLLYALEENPKDGQTFVMIQLEGNRVKLRARGGNFIRVNENDFLVADTNRKDASIFKVYKTQEEEYVLMAPNGLYVRVREKDDRLVARAENPGPRTRFKFRNA